ncbi:MAG: cryptochrome/photolyase family protein [Bacteroidota bacterium]
MSAVNLIFPHQLFEQQPLLDNGHPVYLVEEYLFFKHYPFHQQKIAFHRASMKAYADYLANKNIAVHYVEATNEQSDIRVLIAHLGKEGVETIHFIDPTDNWLEKRIRSSAKKASIELEIVNTPLFLNQKEALLKGFFKPTKKKFFQTSFYKNQRQSREILLDGAGDYLGGKLSFDAENRQKYPKKKTPPPIHYPEKNAYYEEAVTYVNKHFSDHYGTVTDDPLYPTDFAQTETWLDQFLEQRFAEFGPYEDAIVAEYGTLNHSVLTPMLNVGLITPKVIIDRAVACAAANDIPINSTEGFVRQIMGWREFMRGMYEAKGTEERTRNYWGFTRKIPASFYDGTTGIVPIDITIKRLLKTGYCHHIERLMVLGNFMLLCEFDPDEVYQWFMELFIDAYDWVMVPNVYGMSQFADGGLLSTKPYISGSNYLKKMSNYGKGDWQGTWDALFWRFMHVHRDFFLSNPRLGMLIRTFDKKSDEQQRALLETAEAYLENL